MDSEVKKKVLKMFRYGMYICTSKTGDQYSASTVTWVTQASFHPPLVAVGLKVNSGIYQTVQQAGRFALHVVPDGEKELARRFFRPARVEDHRINGVPYELHEQYNLPILLSTPAYLIGDVKEVPELGDHRLVIAEVIDAVLKEEMEPLLLQDTGWSYSG